MGSYCRVDEGMDVDYSIFSDFEGWIELAREVEPLFGPMADEADFQEALSHAICQKRALCIRTASNRGGRTLRGGVVISKESNEIAWLAVSEQYRGQGCGRQLLKFAIRELDPQKYIILQTFDESVFEGHAARKLYFDLGFFDHEAAGLNPAGVPTVIMRLMKVKQ